MDYSDFEYSLTEARRHRGTEEFNLFSLVKDAKIANKFTFSGLNTNDCEFLCDLGVLGERKCLLT